MHLNLSKIRYKMNSLAVILDALYLKRLHIVEVAEWVFFGFLKSIIAKQNGSIDSF